MGNSLRRGRPGTIVVGLLIGLAVLSGCTRRFFRRAADADAIALMDEKNRDPAWQVQSFWVYPHPLARFADPTNPDRPPMPPDDPAADLLSPHPQKPGKAGIELVQGDGYLKLLAEFDRLNRAELAAERDREMERTRERESATPAEPAGPPRRLPEILPPPTPEPNGVKHAVWRDRFPDSGVRQAQATGPLPTNPEATPGATGSEVSTTPATKTEKAPDAYLIKIEQATELALINSREYQQRREILFLAALPVSLQRFSFAWQFRATEQAVREEAGSLFAGGKQNDWRFNSTGSLSKLFPTGALLTAQLANQLVINMAAPTRSLRTLAPSTLTLNLTQPLLRGGGQAVTLEPLTQAERNLLYEIRNYARFRKEFYSYMVAGSNLTFNRFAANSLAGLALTSGTTAPSQGYLPTLLLVGILDNDRQNVATLEKFLKLFEAYKEGGDVSQLQVDQVEQQLLQGRLTVLQDELALRNATDLFKLQLGIPTNIPIEIDYEALRPLIRHVARFQQVFDEVDAARNEANKYNNPDEAGQLRARLRQLYRSARLVQGIPFREAFPRQFGYWEKLPAEQLRKRATELNDERNKLLNLRTDLEVAGKPFPPADARRLGEVEHQLNLQRLEDALRRYEAMPWKKPVVGQPSGTPTSLFRNVMYSFDLVLGEARNERLAQIRATWPALPRVCLKGNDLLTGELDDRYTLVSQYALQNRFDLQNVHAQQMDAWRQIAVQANALQGVLNVSYDMVSNSPPDQANAFGFSGSRTRHQLILNGELPLVRRQERNNYRASLVSYQQARRQVQATEDFVLNDVRVDLRQLRVAAENYKIQQRLVEVSFAQVENALEVFAAPQQPTVGGGSGSQQSNATTAAALTTQLLNAQARLPQVQTSLYTTWINYLIFRTLMYRDLELMPIDARGVWLDELSALDCDGPTCHPDPTGPDAGTGPVAAASGGRAAP